MAARSSRERLTLIAAGAGVGLAAAFNTPLSGLVFVLEEAQRDFRPVVFGAAVAVGAFVGVAGWFAPLAVGGGHDLAEMVLAGQVSLMLIPAWFALHFGLTTASYGTGAPGGIFAPLLVLELEVEPGAPFAGRQVRELGLPPGCMLVRIRDRGREWIPIASTRLEAHMRITAMIAPKAAYGLALVRRGCAEAELSEVPEDAPATTH